VARFPLRKLIASAVIWLLGGVLLGPTRATAEEDMNTALRVYDSGNSTDRKIEEIVFLNAQPRQLTMNCWPPRRSPNDQACRSQRLRDRAAPCQYPG